MWGHEAQGEMLAEVRRVRVEHSQHGGLKLGGGGGASNSHVLPNAQNFDLGSVCAKELNIQVNMLEKEGDNCTSAGERVGRWNKNVGKQPLMMGLVCGH